MSNGYDGFGDLLDGFSGEEEAEAEPLYSDETPQDDQFYEESEEEFYADEDEEDERFLDTSDEVEQHLSEAERRLTKATLYRHFLTGNIFDGPGDQLTLEVEAEFRAFALHQLNTLLGVGEAAGFSGMFSEIEVKVLQLMAQNALKDARVRKAAETTTVQKPAARQAAPPPQRPPSRPQLRPRPLPEGVRPRTPNRQSQPQRPQKPQQPQRPQRLSQQRQQRPQRPQRPPPPPQRQQRPQQQTPRQDQPRRSRIPGDGEMVESRDGKKYKIHWVQMSPSEYGAAMEQKLEKAPFDRAVTLQNGIQVMKTAGGEYFKILRSDLTQQVRSRGAVPMPDAHTLAGISMSKTAEALSRLPAGIQDLASQLSK